jgi:hypothetical protein
VTQEVSGIALDAKLRNWDATPKEARYYQQIASN